MGRKNVLFFSSKGAGPVPLRYMHGILISIRAASLVIRQRDEAVLQVLKFTAFLSAGRTLDEFISLSRGCFVDKSSQPGKSCTKPTCPSRRRAIPKDRLLGQIDEGAQARGYVAASWIIEAISGMGG
jgi:hypothetical protein